MVIYGRLSRSIDTQCVRSIKEFNNETPKIVVGHCVIFNFTKIDMIVPYTAQGILSIFLQHYITKASIKMIVQNRPFGRAFIRNYDPLLEEY